MKCYLGDGVYAELQQDRLKLTAENGIRATDTIYLDSQVYTALLDFVEALKIIADAAKEGDAR
jgi:protein-disulfide isomerase